MAFLNGDFTLRGRLRAVSGLLVGTARFELATPCTPSKCATRLRYVPTGFAVRSDDGSVGFDFQILHESVAAGRGWALGTMDCRSLALLGMTRTYRAGLSQTICHKRRVMIITARGLLLATR